MLHKTARRKATAVSLTDLFNFGQKAFKSPEQRLRNAQFLHSELQTRLAQRVVELEQLPMGISATHDVTDVRNLYAEYYERMANSPEPKTVEDEGDFTTLLEVLLLDHTKVVETMSNGIIEVRRKKKYGFDTLEQQVVDEVLNRFYMARIGLRFLIEHHIVSKDPHPGFSGIIESQCSPIRLAKEAALT